MSNINISPPVIYYHSVAPEPLPDWCLNWLTLPLRFFEDQLAYLQYHNYSTIYLDEWLKYHAGEKKLNKKAVCITFDDGLLDNWVYVFPLAQKYNIHFTLFIAPECVDPREIVRPTLEDVWNGECNMAALDTRGFVSWQELKIMQESGYVDVQSHTMTHEKYVASDHIKSFYYGGANGVYTIWNNHPGIKPFYMSDPAFAKRIHFGTPLFEEKSAVIVNKHHINTNFLLDIQNLCVDFDLEHRPEQVAYELRAKEIIHAYKTSNQLIQSIERDYEYKNRLYYEIIGSKTVLEDRLKKPVQFLCWPHGDNNAETHEIARTAGYLATTSGKLKNEAHKPDRIPRIGAGQVRNNVWLSRQKFNYQISKHLKKQPYYMISLANDFKNKLLHK
ncbi:MAG: polysaccharide deacetylase family protein [Saprospiraceae bacterium]